MIYDFASSQEIHESREYDVCICGAGAAGITLAWFLSSNGMKVALLEGGDKQFTQQSQDIYKANSVGLQAWLEGLRLRYFGGTTNHWSGRSRPFEKEDFRERNDNGLPGWPISFEELNNYLFPAKEILDLPTENTFKDVRGSVITSDKFEPDKHAINPVRFGKKYDEYLTNSPDVDVFLNTNVVNISLADDNKTVNKIDVKTFSGKRGAIKAANFVLSMGGIESARLLLCSNSQITSGIGNQTDMVGRCFMEHMNIELGEFVKEPASWGDVGNMGFFTNPEYAADMGIAMSNITFRTITELKAYGRTAELKKLFNELSCSLGVSEKLQFLYKHRCIGEGVVTTLMEQFPNKNSRLFLADEKDELGLRKVILDWKISEQDRKSIRFIATQMAMEFSRNNLGRMKLRPYILDASMKIPVSPHAHHMGTTRMAGDHTYGVVDPNCKVFGTTNLFVAGSSVFSTGGGGNPTMPIIQLSLRLGKLLASRN